MVINKEETYDIIDNCIAISFLIAFFLINFIFIPLKPDSIVAILIFEAIFAVLELFLFVGIVVIFIPNFGDTQ